MNLRHAIHALGRMKGTALLAAVTLALGIGAAATTFSAIYAAVFRQLPFAEADRLVLLSQLRTDARNGTVRLRWSFAGAGAVKRAARALDSASFSRASVGIAGPSTDLGAEQVEGELVTSGYFEALRARPAIGQAFAAADDTSPRPAVVISDRLWRRRFDANPAVLGQAIAVNGVPMTIAGVMPPGFAGVSGQAVIWMPTGMAPRLTYRDYLTTPQHFINTIGRLRDGVSLAQANAELAAAGPQLPYPEGDPSSPPAQWSAGARLLSDARIDASQRRSLTLVLGGAGALLLVTCINVATLLLARARNRRGEMAIRLALGASRGRLIRQLLAETGVIAAGGGALGVMVASWGVAWLRASAPPILASAQNDYGQIGTFSDPSMDPVILLFVLALTIVSTVASGTLPAIHASRSDPAETLAGSSRSLAGARGRALASLVVCQIGVAVLLLSGAILLVRTVTHLEAGRAAIETQALSFWVNAPASRYTDEQGPAVVERILASIRQVPGVIEAGVNRCTPYGAGCARARLFMPGGSPRAENAPVVGRHYVSASYFRASGIALRRGRLLDDNDRAGRPTVTVVNETAARRFWPGEDPVGKRVWFSSNPGFTDPEKPVEVVGVVADVKYWPIDEPVGPDFYTSYLQFTYPSSLYVVNARDVAAIVPAIRRAVASADPPLPIHDVQLLGERVTGAVSGRRFTALATAIFAASAAALAALGVFGVMAYSVAARRDELALRLALGQTPRGLRAGVLLHAARLAAIGCACGVIAGAWLLRSIASALYGVSPTDPAALALAAGAMGSVALIAAAIPAWRASRTDPLLALRAR